MCESGSRLDPLSSSLAPDSRSESTEDLTTALNTPPFLEKNQKFVCVFVQNPSIGLTANTTL